MSYSFLNSLPAKILRVALVFVLVFGMTLHVEYVAFAASSSSDEDKITGINIYTVDDDDLVRSSGKDQTFTPEIDQHQGSLRLAATADLDSGGEKSLDGYAQWSVEKKDLELAKVDEETGVVEATGAGNGTVTVTCTLPASEAVDLAPGTTKKDGFKLSVKLKVSEQVPAYVTSIQILDASGHGVGGSPRAIELDANEADGYGLQAEVGVHFAQTGADVFTCTPEQGLSYWTDGALDDLSWSASGSADIDDNGVLSMNGATETEVNCTADVWAPGESEQPDTIAVKVVGGESESTSSGGESTSSSSEEESSSSSSEERSSSSSSEEDSSSSSSGTEEPAMSVSALEILKEDGSSFADDGALELEVDTAAAQDDPTKAATASYRFGARMTATDGKGGTYVYRLANGAWTQEPQGAQSSAAESTAAGEAAAQTATPPDALLNSLSWTVDPQEGASVNSQGVLSLEAGKTTTVTLSAQSADGAAVQSGGVSVTAKAAVATEPHLAKVEILKEDGTPFGEGESLTLTAEGAASGSSSAAAGSSSSAAGTESPAESVGVAQYRFGAQATVEFPAAAGDADAHGSQGSQGSEGTAAGEPKTVVFVHGDDGWKPAEGQDAAGVQAPAFLGNVTWGVTPAGEDAQAASIDASGQLTIKAGTLASVSCTAGDGEQAKTATLDVTAGAPEKKAERYIESIELLKEDGNAFAPDESLTLADDGTGTGSSSSASGSGKSLTYHFGARAVVVDPETGSKETFVQSGAGWVPASEAAASSGSTAGSESTGSSAAQQGSSSSASGESGFPFTVTWTAQGVEHDGAAASSASITQAGELTIASGVEAVVTCSSASGKDGETVMATVAVNPQNEQPSEGLHLSYTPVPEGQTAFISSFVAGISNITYITHWEENSGNGWTEVEPKIGEGITGSQNLERPTVAPYIGRQYRAYIEIISDPARPKLYSEPVTIQVAKDGLSVFLDVKYVAEGQDAWFTTTVRGLKSGETVSKYTWYEWDTAGNAPKVVTEGYTPTYKMLTERSKFGYRYRVVIETSEGRTKESNFQMLAALDSYQDVDVPNPDADSSSSSTNSGSSGAGGKTPNPAPSDPTPTPAPTPSGGDTPSNPTDAPDDSGDADNPGTTPDQPTQPAPQEPTTPDEPAEPNTYQTLSQMVDQNGEASVSFDDGTTGTMKPAGSVKMANESSSPDDIIIDSEVTQELEQLRDQKAEEQLNAEPGARWNPLYFKNKTPEVKEVLDTNWLVPFVLPFVLGLLAAGALEKFLRYREQKRPSRAVFR